MEPSKPMEIVNKLRRGSMDSNMDMRRDSMDSSSSMQESRSASFEGGRSVDEARLRMWRDNRAKKMWEQPDPATAFYSA